MRELVKAKLPGVSTAKMKNQRLGKDMKKKATHNQRLGVCKDSRKQRIGLAALVKNGTSA